MRTHRTLALGATILALVVSACSSGEGSGSPTASDPATSTGASASAGAEGERSIVIGSAGFYEAQLMAEIYAQALEANGYTVERKLGIGPRETTQPAHEAGDFDLQPEYIGSLTTFLGGEASGDPDETFAALETALEAVGLTPLDYTPAQDQNAFVVRQETADENSLTTMSDLTDVSGDLVWGLPPECETNALCAGVPPEDDPDGDREGGLSEYGIDYDEIQIESYAACDAPVAQALNDGVVDVAELCSTQPDIERFNFVVLEDDLQTQPSENIAPIVSTEWLEAAPDDFADILNAVSAEMDTETLTSLGVEVAVDQEDVADVAEQWLTDNGLN
ncbi:MAG: glycine betaine ABC transporter substrate-binding protein [Candidatus Limnocylindria bacterium]